MKLKQQIIELIIDDSFPTPKKIKWKLKEQGLFPTKEEEEYIFNRCQFKLEELSMTLKNPAQISVVHKYLRNNFNDWNEEISNVDDGVSINLTFDNNSENKL